ncbi:MAG: alpha/beta fold hydrolase [bacterium]|nr:alpha/beta fold hydrolase [bacterium]
MFRMTPCYLLVAILVGAPCIGATDETASAPVKVPQAGSLFMYPERIPLEGGGFFNAERGMLFVPANRSKASSEVISIEVYRFRRLSSADPAAPPIFYLHGGPSFGGLERSLRNLGTFEERWLPLVGVSDVVVVSQRGIGPSKPTTTIDVSVPPTPLNRSHDSDTAAKAFRRSLVTEKTAWEQLGVDLTGFTVLEAAEDLNDVRKALGYSKVVLWGGSFGSHWGMAFMRTHPELVERAILRGMEGPDHTYDHPGHIWNVYRRVAEEAENAPELAGMVPEGGLIRALETVVERIDEKPMTVEVEGSDAGGSHKVLIDGEVVRRLARGYSGELSAWPADVITMYRGNFGPAAERIVQIFERSGARSSTASFFMLDCGSGITSERLAEYQRDPAASLLRRMNWWYIEGCPVWGSDLGDDFRRNFETDIPTVIVHGTWDTSTPYENALELLPFFKQSKFVPVLRGPHGAIRAAMNASTEFKIGLLHFAATGDTSRLPNEVEMPAIEWVVPDVSAEVD